MKKLWGLIGTGLFWIFWPAWIIYFRFSRKRSRVLIVFEEEILLVQSWLGVKEFDMPGGGTKKHEEVRAGAVRELREELGIEVAESSLIPIGKKMHKKNKLHYKAEIFCLQLQEKPSLMLARLEIFKAEWLPLFSLDNYHVSDEVLYAAKRYQPPEQASLL